MGSYRDSQLKGHMSGGAPVDIEQASRELHVDHYRDGWPKQHTGQGTLERWGWGGGGQRAYKQRCTHRGAGGSRYTPVEGHITSEKSKQMCVCVHVSQFVFMCVCASVCVCVHPHIFISIYLSIFFLTVYIYTCMCIILCVFRIGACMYSCLYTKMKHENTTKPN